ncbi:MAG: NAD-dependent epimerase [Firmicutes bacterium]|nr:NAD-dependent epimerase [Bacillota bacterium]
MTILVTGAAGFIGFHLSKRLLENGYNVVGLDNLNDYYEVELKKSRLALLQEYKGFTFVKASLEERKAIEGLFSEFTFSRVINLAAQAGVRYSIENPYVYIDSNVVGFMNILEACRRHRVGHLIFASSSSVYGANRTKPFSVHHNVDHPVSLYAATKKAGELMAHTYSSLYGLPVTGLRFFTVYGPWGRPDMAYFSFTRAILEGKPIKVFNYGKMKRDFTYIDDIVEGTVRLIDRVPQPDPQWDGMRPNPGRSYAPYRIYNIGNNQPVELLYFIEVLERALGREAKKELLPMQPGDVLETYADIDDLALETGFKPGTSIEEGIGKFVAWYKEYYRHHS